MKERLLSQISTVYTYSICKLSGNFRKG